MNKFDRLIKDFNELLQDKSEILLQGYELDTLIECIKKAENK